MRPLRTSRPRQSICDPGTLSVRMGVQRMRGHEPLVAALGGGVLSLSVSAFSAERFGRTALLEGDGAADMTTEVAQVGIGCMCRFTVLCRYACNVLPETEWAMFFCFVGGI